MYIHYLQCSKAITSSHFPIRIVYFLYQFPIMEIQQTIRGSGASRNHCNGPESIMSNFIETLFGLAYLLERYIPIKLLWLVFHYIVQWLSQYLQLSASLFDSHVLPSLYNTRKTPAFGGISLPLRGNGGYRLHNGYRNCRVLLQFLYPLCLWSVFNEVKTILTFFTPLVPILLLYESVCT